MPVALLPLNRLLTTPRLPGAGGAVRQHRVPDDHAHHLQRLLHGGPLLPARVLPRHQGGLCAVPPRELLSPYLRYSFKVL